MQRLSTRLLPALAVQFGIHILFFTLVSWILLSNLFGFDFISVLSCGFLLGVSAIFLEWLFGPSMALSTFRPSWIEREGDYVLWSMVHGEAAKAGVNVRSIGIVDMEAPNALTFTFITGRSIILFTKGLLIDLTYPEVRAVAAYLMGCSKSGVLGFVTTLTGLLTLSHRVARRYIVCHFESKNCGLIDIMLAGWGGLIFALTYPQSVMVSSLMSVYSDEFSILQTRNPSRLLSALIKVSSGLAQRPMDPIRTDCAPLKCLMFQDPTIALRDASFMKDAADRYGIELSRLLGNELRELPSRVGLKFHIFERFWSQPGLSDRLEHAYEYGRKFQ